MWRPLACHSVRECPLSGDYAAAPAAEELLTGSFTDRGFTEVGEAATECDMRSPPRSGGGLLRRSAVPSVRVLPGRELRCHDRASWTLLTVIDSY